jgi:hypothetical protein
MNNRNLRFMLTMLGVICAQTFMGASISYGGTVPPPDGNNTGVMCPIEPPSIVNFRAIYNGNNNWTLTGVVSGQGMAGRNVMLGGIPSLDNNNASASVQDSGSFSYTFTAQPGECGGVVAQVTNSCGQPSNEATSYIFS